MIDPPAPSIYVYYLAAASTLVAKRGALEKSFGVTSSEDRVLDISDATGELHYADLSKLWKNDDASTLPASASAADQAARSELSRLARETGLVVPVERDLVRFVGAEQVYAPDRDEPDHWLCQYVMLVPTGTLPGPGDPARPVLSAADVRGTTRELAAVSGTEVDVHIGVRSELVALTSRWRPHRRSELVSRVPPPGSAHPPGSDPPGPTIVYLRLPVENGDDVLTPFYELSDDEDDVGELSPACELSSAASALLGWPFPGEQA